MNCVYRIALATLVLACISMSGCATIVKGSTQTITVQTEPDGAKCELVRDGQTIGAVNPTPGTVQVEKARADIEVTCRVKGFTETSTRVSSTFQGWTAGNLLIGGLIGLAVDAGSGAINQYPSEVALKLVPEKFSSAVDREDFYEKWRAEVLQNSAKAKIAASKVCVKEQCDEMSKRIDQETEQALAGIEANRNLRANPSAPGTPPAATAPATPQAPVAVSAAAPAAPSERKGMPKTGDRWTYQLVDNARPVGKIVIEAAGVSGAQVRERITREGWPGFVAEREVPATFDVVRFLDPVKLPGGYQFAEISPYAPPGTDLPAGKSWSDIQGSVFIMFFGTQRFLAQAKVVRKESVKVPAGTFDAWRIEADSENQWTARTVRLRYTYWYSPAMSRTVKMIMDVDPQSQAHTVDTYELVSYQPGM